MSGEGDSAMQLKTRISLFIVLIIALHAVPVLYERGRQTRWPFLSWTMYAKSFPPGPITMATRRLVATSASGREEVTRSFSGCPCPRFETHTSRPFGRETPLPPTCLSNGSIRGGAIP